MPIKASELSALAVSRLKAPGLHFVGGVAGLALQVTSNGSQSWILRFRVGSKRRDMGLGGYPDTSLAQAKEKARTARDKARNGIDPIDEARAARSLLAAQQAAALTFDQCAEPYIKAHEAGWKSAKHAAQWRNTIGTYASPLLGKMLVRDVALPHVQQILESLWEKKTETASRLRVRLESILDWATIRGYRTGENPARWRGHLDQLLPKRSKVQKVQHFAALPWREIGAFMAELRQQRGIGALALEFTILTAARSGETRGATWAEIDLDRATWTIRPERMKASKEHRVPLSPAALEILRTVPRVAGSDYVFPSAKNGPLSDMTLSAVLRRMNRCETVHGFRSTFRDWAAESTAYPHECVEMALAHTVGNKVEAAYRRGDLFEKRVRLMADWATFCAHAPVSGEVVSIRRAV